MTLSNFPNGITTKGALIVGAGNVFGRIPEDEHAVIQAGTSVYDATADIHAVRDDGGSTVSFPDGTFLVTGLTANVADQEWVLSPGTIIKLADASDTSLLTATANGVKISGGKLDANRANQSSGSAIFVSGDDCVFQDIWITSSQFRGIHGIGAGRVTVRGCTITDVATIPIGIDAASGEDSEGHIIEHNFIDKTDEPAATGVGQCIGLVNENAGKIIKNNRVIGNTCLMMASPTSETVAGIWGRRMVNSTVANNVLIGGAMGISLDTSADYNAVSGNTIKGPNSIGIEIAESDFCTVIGNAVEGNSVTPNGIALTDVTSEDCVIGNNIVSGCTTRSIFINGGDRVAVTGNLADGANINLVGCLDSVVSANKVSNTGTSHGIHLQSSCDQIAISGNTVVASGTGDPIQAAGSSNVAITGNMLDGSSMSGVGIELNNTSPAVVSGNLIRDTGTAAVSIFKSNAGTLDYISITGNSFIDTGTTGNEILENLSGGAVFGDNVQYSSNTGSSRNSRQCDQKDVLNDVIVAWGAGTPESVVTAGPGSHYYRNDGGAGTGFYIKESGTGNTGWVAK